MFTVMLGLLLALGLESIVEWRHHKHLALKVAAAGLKRAYGGVLGTAAAKH